MFKTVEEFQNFSKSQLEAATQSATALSSGFQQLLTEAADYSKKSLESSSSALQSLMGSRSIQSAIQVQMDFAKSALETAVAESTKVTGLMSATAQNVFKPLEGAFAQAKGTVQADTSA